MMWLEPDVVAALKISSVVERIVRDENCWIRTKEEAETWAEAFPRWQALWEKKALE